jgi:hypothetical protein
MGGGRGGMRGLRRLARHCDAVGRDPAGIRRTLLMPIRITDDARAVARFVRAPGPGTVERHRQYVIDRIGAITTGDAEQYPRVDADACSALA